MDAAVAKTTGIDIDSMLVGRIVALSSSSAPEQYPEAAASETVEIMRRREAEEHFQRTLSRRTWWRLTEHERATLRAAILAKEPLCTRPDSPWLESECCREILRVLERAHRRA